MFLGLVIVYWLQPICLGGASMSDEKRSFGEGDSSIVA